MGKMWMGPRGGETWVPCEAIGGDRTTGRWTASAQYLNGRAGIRSSKASHMRYGITWNKAKRSVLAPIQEMASGARGDGQIYLVDPAVLGHDRNVLPEHWSFPGQATYDAPVLIGNKRPARADTPGNPLNYPRESAIYSLVTGDVGRTCYIPIPPGYTAWVGVHGSKTGTGGVQVTTVSSNGAAGATQMLTMLSVTDQTRVNASFDSSLYGGIELQIVKGSSTALTLSGIIVQLLKNGDTPQPGGWIIGGGNDGCEFDGPPTQTIHSAALDLWSTSVKLVEAD